MISPTDRRDADAAEVPTTLLLGRGWPAAGPVPPLARRLARVLGHGVAACDLEAPPGRLRRLLGTVVARGTRSVVLLPVTLDTPARAAGSAVDAVIASLRAWPDLGIHRGRAPATDDVVRMLGDRAREVARALGAGRHRADVVVVIATAGRANPVDNADAARLARLVYEAHGFGDVTCAFIEHTTPRVGEVVTRWARLGARGIVVVPHVLFDHRVQRQLVREARAAGAATGVALTIARPLDGHPGLVPALVRRHLEALTEAATGAGGPLERPPWVNPALLRALHDGHGHGPSMDWEGRLAALLAPRYRDPGIVVGSAPMGAAPLARDAEGRVAWDRMWQGFCELALAGGPPHRGTLLEAVSPDEVLADLERHAEVLAELARGLRMVTGLVAVLDGPRGWIGLRCDDEEMAIWLMRAIVVENIMVRREGAVLFLPAGPRFTLEGEIKNVVTAVAKTHHYWVEHQAARGAGAGCRFT
jgi:sirohydrochlorin cobaltochelatase